MLIKVKNKSKLVHLEEEIIFIHSKITITMVTVKWFNWLYIFCITGSQLIMQPKMYITIIAHTPFFKMCSQQVLVQGWLLMTHNIDDFLQNVYNKLTDLEDQLAQVIGLINFSQE